MGKIMKKIYMEINIIHKQTTHIYICVGIRIQKDKNNHNKPEMSPVRKEKKIEKIRDNHKKKAIKEIRRRKKDLGKLKKVRLTKESQGDVTRVLQVYDRRTKRERDYEDQEIGTALIL